MCSYNRFSYLFGILNFGPKLILLQRPLRLGEFCPFSKCSHFPNIRCFLVRFFAQINSNVVAQLLFAPFWCFYVLAETDQFAKAKTFAFVANFGDFQNALIFPILGVSESGFLHTLILLWSYNCFSHFFSHF